ncbi:MAG: carbohydrate ABC transporter permease [Treponema sp.]|jgi:multiple sugar transport system permease protein|nr:carbohydrate ABC transporter permease [Treponema sp.]
MNKKGTADLGGFLERNRLSNGYLLKKTAGSFVYKTCRAILLFGLCFLIVQPLLDKLSVSFMEQRDLYDATVISIPRHFTLGNYLLASQLLDFLPSLFQTLSIVVISSALQIASCTLAGYGFARYKFPLKNFWFMCVMLIIVVPPQTIMASLYLNFRFFDVFGIIRLIAGAPLNLLNSAAGYWLLSAAGMGLKSGLYIFMLRQYFRGVPKELEEAAYVDGCGRFATFIRLMLPDAAPMLTSCFLFSFVWQWTDSFYSTLFLTNYKMLASGLGGLADRLAEWWAVINGSNSVASTIAPVGYTQAIIATGMLMCLAPLVLLYIMAQKAFVESLSQTGIKM